MLLYLENSMLQWQKWIHGEGLSTGTWAQRTSCSSLCPSHRAAAGPVPWREPVYQHRPHLIIETAGPMRLCQQNTYVRTCMHRCKQTLTEGTCTPYSHITTRTAYWITISHYILARTQLSACSGRVAREREEFGGGELLPKELLLEYIFCVIKMTGKIPPLQYIALHYASHYITHLPTPASQHSNHARVCMCI